MFSQAHVNISRARAAKSLSKGHTERFSRFEISKALHLGPLCELQSRILWCFGEDPMATSDDCYFEAVPFVLGDLEHVAVSSSLALQLERYQSDLSKTADVST
jgi:hypothetical protein